LEPLLLLLLLLPPSKLPLDMCNDSMLNPKQKGDLSTDTWSS
jgi:hypothetical protein